jgi:hypothetical protein
MLTAQDQFNNPVTSYSGNVQLSANGGNPIFPPADVAVGNGSGSFSVVLNAIGLWTISGTDANGIHGSRQVRVTTAAAPTPVGSPVGPITPTDLSGNSQPITLTFPSVTSAGGTNAVPVSMTAPANFQLSGGTSIYNITTTATYTTPIKICFTGGPFKSGDVVQHYENGNWIPLLPATLLPPGGPYTQICGDTNSLSPFGVFTPENTLVGFSGNLSNREGNSGTTPFEFTVILSNPSYQKVAVNYTTVVGTATVADGDYIAASGTLTFQPGETTKTVTVLANGDTKVESDETFTVVLSDPANATIDNGAATGTILNDDVADTTPPRVVSITRASANPTSAASVSWTVTFSENVTGVDPSDFALPTAGVTGAFITSVTGTNTVYTVTANTGTGSGTLALKLGDDDSVRDAANNPLGGPNPGNGNFAGEVYTIDKSPATLVKNLIALVSSPDLGLKSGQINSLTDKLNNALTSIQQGLYKQAINQLEAFISDVQNAQKTGRMNSETSSTLIAAANAIVATLSKP